MRRISITILVLSLTLSSISIAKAEGWAKKADMPTPRHNFACAVNDKIYAIGGSTQFNPEVITAIVEEYDPISNKWSKRADLPMARRTMAGGAVNGKIYAMGGVKTGMSVVFSTVEEYDPELDKWEKKTDMPTARYYMGADVVDNRIYVISGVTILPESGKTFIAAVEEYTPEGLSSGQSVSPKGKLAITWGMVRMSEP